MKAASAAVVALMLCVAACAPARVALDDSAHHHIRKIALLDIDDPAGYGIIGSSGGIFGALGAAAMIPVTERRGEQLTAAMHAQNLHLGTALGRSLEAKLRAQGYDVIPVTVLRPEPNKLLENYAAVRTDADAILDVSIMRVSYLTGPFRDYMPQEVVWARMVTVPGHEVIYFDHMIYSTTSPADIEPPKGTKNTFSSFDEMTTEPGAVAAALERSVDPIAAHIAHSLGSPLAPTASPVAAGTD